MLEKARLFCVRGLFPKTSIVLTRVWVVVHIGITQVLISQELANASHRHLGLWETKRAQVKLCT